MLKEMQTAYENTISKLEQLLHSFNQSALNVIPFEGSWTAGQVGEHVVKSQLMIAGLLYGKTNVPQRNPYEKKETLKGIFLNFSTKMTSPEFILPSAKSKQKEELISQLKTGYDKITNVIQSLNLTEICLEFALPGLGEMTRAEWIYFIIYHTQRHIHQLENISQKLPADTAFHN